MHHLLDSVMLGFTAIGKGSAVWLLIGVAGTVIRRVRGMALCQLCLALLFTATITEAVLKPLVHEPRPYEVNRQAVVLGERPTSYSFPSGHASSSFAGAVALSRGWPAGGLAWFVLAALISYSRVYLGVHTWVDVVGGVLVGLACGYFAVGRTRWSERLSSNLEV